LAPIRITIDGQFDIQQIIFLNGQSVEPGKNFLADFLIVNPEFNNAIISDLIFISTISGPGGEYTIDLTNLGFYSDGYQLLWEVPEDAAEGDYTASISRKADKEVVGTFEFRVASVIPIPEPRPWQFYAVVAFGISLAGLLLIYFRQVIKELSRKS